jgi:hypothetical protein
MTWLLWIGIAVACFIGYQLVAWYNTKRISALNAVHAALTYRTLNAGQAGSVDGKIVNICHRLGVDIALLGESFPISTSSSGVGASAVVYAFRSLAMYELGIQSVDSDLPRWYVLRNPLNAALAVNEISKYREKYELKHGISLVEFDPN